LLSFVTVRAGVVAEADADRPLRDVLAAALEANKRLTRLAEELTAENARLREENARLRERETRREAELERLRADLAVVQRLVFGRFRDHGPSCQGAAPWHRRRTRSAPKPPDRAPRA
jgi:hypothetical protein